MTNIQVRFGDLALFSAYKDDDCLGVKVGKTSAIHFTPAVTVDSLDEPVVVLIAGEQAANHYTISKVRHSKKKQVSALPPAYPLMFPQGLSTVFALTKAPKEAVTPQAAFEAFGPVGDAAITATPPKKAKRSKAKRK